MRILLDEHDIPWHTAWEITQATMGYTNHTLLPEAMEKWPVSLMEYVLPRHMQIIYEINHQFLQHVSSVWPGDLARLQRMSLIEDGRLTTWLLNTASARQLGMTTTGHASRGLASPPGVGAHNIVLSAGPKSCAELLKDAGKGVIVTSMFGPSVNSDTGDWSAGASGFWFENGEIQYPVNEITVAGNLIDMYQRLIPAADLEIRGTMDTPSLLIDSLSVGGK